MNHNLEDSDASTYSVQGNTSLRFSYSVESDAIGNITYIDGIEIEWDGRRAVGVQQGNNTITYEYNIDGQRTKKTVNGIATEYFYNGDILAGQKTGDNVLVFMYDNNGDIFGFEYNGTPYYYLKNAQNDVVMVFNSYDRTAVIYQYDAWGNITDVYDSTTQRVSNINPITYRSYYYDIEMGVYYLNSRYYAPVICRFMSADSYVQTGQGMLDKNMFAYCGNNPVNYVDPTGCFIEYIIAGLFLIVTVLILDAVFDTIDEATSDLAENENEDQPSDLLSPERVLNNSISAVMDATTDTVISAIKPASVLSPTIRGIKTVGNISKSMGIASFVTVAGQLVWDYCTYANDPKSFAIATSITVISTAAAIGIGAVIMASGVAPVVALASAVVSGIVISYAEDKARQWLLA